MNDYNNNNDTNTHCDIATGNPSTTRVEGERKYDQHQSTAVPILRFHIVRHAETASNFANLVLGQMDSPLTLTGEEQAILTGKSLASGASRRRKGCIRSNDNNTNQEIYFSSHNGSSNDENPAFWKILSSDLPRARKTTALILKALQYEHNDPSPTSNRNNNDCDKGESHQQQQELSMNMQDVRLRERAKGAREGRSKSISMEKAIEMHHSENEVRVNNYGLEPLPIPFFETEDEVWDRVVSLMDDLVVSAIEMTRGGGGDAESNAPRKNFNGVSSSWEDCNQLNDTITTFSITSSTNTQLTKGPRMLRILLVSHSTTIRIMLNTMFQIFRPFPSIKDSDMDEKETTSQCAIYSQMAVPNASITCIDIEARPENYDSYCAWMKGEEEKHGRSSGRLWTVTAISCPDDSHLHS